VASRPSGLRHVAGVGDDELRLANAVLERDGRFKLVGFDNGL
jgi:hypothetical protein